MCKARRVMTTAVVLVSFLLFFGSCGVKAKEEPCKAEAERFCKGVESGEGRLDACLSEHRAELSPKCVVSLNAKADQGKEKEGGEGYRFCVPVM